MAGDAPISAPVAPTVVAEQSVAAATVVPRISGVQTPEPAGSVQKRNSGMTWCLPILAIPILCLLILLVVGVAGLLFRGALSPAGPTSVGLPFIPPAVTAVPVRWSEIRRFEGHLQGVNTVAFSPDGSMLASGGDDDAIMIWETSTGRVIQRLTGPTADVNTVAFSPDGQTLAVATGDGEVSLWDVQGGFALRQLAPPSRIFLLATGLALSVAFSPDNATVIGARNSDVAVWPGQRPQINLRSEVTTTVSAVAIAADGRTIASGRYGGPLQLWDLSSQQLLKTLSTDPVTVWSTAFSPKGSLLATGGSDNLVRLWNYAGDQSPRVLSGHSDIVRAVAFSPDGGALATGGVDKSVRIWDVANGRQVARLDGHTGWIRGVAFAPQGGLLATASGDKTIRLWAPS